MIKLFRDLSIYLISTFELNDLFVAEYHGMHINIYIFNEKLIPKSFCYRYYKYAWVKHIFGQNVAVTAPGKSPFKVYIGKMLIATNL